MGEHHGFYLENTLPTIVMIWGLDTKYKVMKRQIIPKLCKSVRFCAGMPRNVLISHGMMQLRIQLITTAYSSRISLKKPLTKTSFLVLPIALMAERLFRQ